MFREGSWNKSVEDRLVDILAALLSGIKDAVWAHVFAMYLDVENGVMPIPELQTVIDGLPEYTFEYVEAVE